MNYNDIQLLISNQANYHVDCNFLRFDRFIRNYINDYDLILNPDFQRGHVWTEKQQIAYVEYVLQGGVSGKDLYFNSPSWFHPKPSGYDEFVCVDGLQRITAILKFLDNEIPVFGHFRSEFTGRPRVGTHLHIHVNDLQTKADVLKWYIQMNDGGTPHSKEEIERVKHMLERERN